MTGFKDTIVAPATPPGKGGIAIVRLSGSEVKSLAEKLLKTSLTPRVAHFLTFFDKDNDVIDEGVAIYFKAPHSFTGEDVLELHGHGSPVVVDRLIKRCTTLGARMARPGEFSERAFLNNKIDLTQAEAICDLINASSEAAAKSAIHSLQGEFSEKINKLVERLIQLRMYVEAAIDFPEEEIDFLSDGKVSVDLNNIISQLKTIRQTAKQGAILNEGLVVTIIGKPNVGKSSLLNLLSQRESAIVTDIAGTTRDVLREYINIDGMPLHIVDTAGLRESGDVVEQEGIKRAKRAIDNANVILWVEDITQLSKKRPDSLPKNKPVILIKNKTDLLANKKSEKIDWGETIVAEVNLSTKTGEGLEALKQALKSVAGFHENEGTFLARRRHLEALDHTLEVLQHGEQQLTEHQAGELLAEDLRQAQQALSEITGEFTSDDLLGKIFSSFCIGK